MEPFALLSSIKSYVIVFGHYFYMSCRAGGILIRKEYLFVILTSETCVTAALQLSRA